jgi:hypothetical protein
MRLWVVALVASSTVWLQAQAPGEVAFSLPEREGFFAAVRGNVARAQREQNRYAYKERRSELHTNPFGRLGTGGTRLIEVVPDPTGLMATRRVLERDGRTVTAPSDERITLPQRREGGGTRGVDDVVRTLEFTIAGRQAIAGEDYILLDFVPRAAAKPTTRQGRLARVLRGRMWVLERAQEIARVEATAMDDISYGFGVVARIHKGARVVAERKPVAGGVWMPTSLRFTGAGRALLFRKLDVDYSLEWFDYSLIEGAPAGRP